MHMNKSDAYDAENNGDITDSQPFCPSARPETSDSVVFGVVGGTVEEPRVGYLKDPRPVDNKTLALSEPVKPTEVFRIAAPCASSACQHFESGDCQLAKKIVSLLPAAVDRLPRCRLRPKCRWWKQEGRAACMRCPLIVTECYHPTDQQRQAADPRVQRLTVTSSYSALRAGEL